MEREFKRLDTNRDILDKLDAKDYLVVMDMGQQRLQDGWWPLTTIKRDGADVKILGGDGEWHKIDENYACMYRRAFEAKKLIEK